MYEESPMSDQNTHPAISVLVPVYNTERYLEECLLSLLTQTFADFEVLCIDDGSTDSSNAIIKRFMAADPRFHIIEKPNSGYGASMNQGLDQARGTYVAILESDDVMLPDALETLHGAAAACDAQAAKADFALYWSTPEERIEPFGLLEGLPTGHAVNPRDAIDIFYAKPSIWSGLYLRSFLNDNGIRFLETSGASYQDASFNFKVWASAERVAFVDQVVLLYRQDNEASSVNAPGKVFCVCDEYAEMQRWVDEKAPDLQAVLCRMKFDSYLWNYDRLAPELRQRFLPRAAEELRADLDSGRLALALFEPYAEADLRAMLTSPEAFDRSRQLSEGSPGKLTTFQKYYELGGLPLIFKLLAFKTRGGR